MKKNKKLFIILTAIGSILIAVGLFLIIFLKDDENKPNDPSVQEPVVNEENVISGKKEHKGLVVNNLKIDGEIKYTVSFDVVNNGDKDYNNLVVDIDFYREDRGLISTITANIGALKKGESKKVEVITFDDYTSAKDYDIYIIHE